MKRPAVNKSDPYFGKVIKYVPTEIIAGYAAASGFVKALPPSAQFSWFCIISIALLLLTPLYLMASTHSAESAYAHAVAGALAFAAWVFATGGPFEHFQIDEHGGWYHRAMGSVVLILVCLALPLVEKFVPRRAQPVASGAAGPSGRLG